MKETNIQGAFLKPFYEFKNPVEVFLMSGIKLRGTITEIGEGVIILNDRQMIYTHAISTIQAEGRK